MILSVSRRTDIPHYYSEWFYNRVREGFLYVRNPMNEHQVSRVSLDPESVECIVFWTKNPGPMMERLGELEAFPYFFQFTLTGYGRDIEPGLPDKRRELIPVFRRLAGQIGADRVVWRYDPIFFGGRYSPDYHLRAFAEIAGRLSGCTGKVVISFLDLYGKTRRNMSGISTETLPVEELRDFASRLSAIAGENGMCVETCAEKMDLSACGIRHGSCIDREMIGHLLGCPVEVGKDRNQRTECGCVESVETGSYDTCLAGCRYCYANDSEGAVHRKRRGYDPKSPILCGALGEGDKVTQRRVRMVGKRQIELF